MNNNPQISAFEQAVIDFVIELRKEKGLTQQDLANILHLSRGFIGDVENSSKPAKYNLDHINAFADYFNMSPRQFIPEKAIPI